MTASSCTILAIAATIALTTPVSAQERLSQEQISAAIAEGRGKKELKPARVAKRALIRSALQYELGHLYTPSMRVAIAARQAARAYKPFTAADVTDAMAGDVLLFVVPPQQVGRSAMNAIAAETILVMPKGSKDPAKAIRPIETSIETTAYMNAFGAKWDEHTIIATFDRSVVAKGLEFVVVYRNGEELRGEIVDELR